MSIFNKICPECAAVNSAEATSCGCGYSYEDSERSYSRITEEMIAEEENLYQEYLAARAKQAVEAVESVKHQISFSPIDANNKRETIAQARLEAKIAMADLAAQRARTAAANKIVAKSRNKRLTRDKAKNRLAEISRKHKHNAKAGKDRKAKAIAEEARKARAAAEEARKAKVAAEEARKARAAAEEARKAKVAAEEARKARAAAADKAKKRASAAFKAAQARKARAAMMAVKAKKQGNNKNTTKVDQKTHTYRINSNKAAAAFRSTQAKRVQQLAQKKECPNCTTSVNADVWRCNCGYNFPKGTAQLPALSLNADEIIEIKVNSYNERR